MKNPSFFDHFKRRSENTKHTYEDNKDVTLDFGLSISKAVLLTEKLI
jgi:hypothetical protein